MRYQVFARLGLKFQDQLLAWIVGARFYEVLEVYCIVRGHSGPSDGETLEFCHGLWQKKLPYSGNRLIDQPGLIHHRLNSPTNSSC